MDRVAQLLLIPFVPVLMKRYDARYIAAIGIAIFAASSFMNLTLSLDTAGDQLMIPNIVRAIGQALILTPLSSITTGGISPSEAGAASGLSNMLRNLGGAVGTATLATVLTKREQFHSNIIGQSVTLYRDEVRQRIDRDDELLPGARRLRSRDGKTSGNRRHRRHRQASSSHHRLQRHLRRHWCDLGDCSPRAPVRAQGQTWSRSRGALTNPTAINARQKWIQHLYDHKFYQDPASKASPEPRQNMTEQNYATSNARVSPVG